MCCAIVAILLALFPAWTGGREAVLRWVAQARGLAHFKCGFGGRCGRFGLCEQVTQRQQTKCAVDGAHLRLAWTSTSSFPQEGDDDEQGRIAGRMDQRASQEFLKKEKAFTHARDELSAARRELPWVKVTKDYAFETEDGKKTLKELFGKNSQLIVYHFMFAPGAEG